MFMRWMSCFIIVVSGDFAIAIAISIKLKTATPNLFLLKDKTATERNKAIIAERVLDNNKPIKNIESKKGQNTLKNKCSSFNRLFNDKVNAKTEMTPITLIEACGKSPNLEDIFFPKIK